MTADKVKIEIPERANFIIKTLMEAGFEAYVVGGCVRDSILGRVPQDWDITTSADPYRVKELFRRTVDTGLQHGTVTVMLGDEGFEVTTYRLDGIYEDGRHPKEVTFTRELREDLRRRDFTINAMAYNDEEGLVDMFDGLGDIDRKLIKCVGDPHERFSEDALRMLRAVRFAAQLGYEIDEDTEKAIIDLAGNLEKISAERIHTELIKLLVSDHPMELKKAYETGMTAVFLPEFDDIMKTPQKHLHHCYDVGEHTLISINNIRPDPVLRLAMLFHDIAKSKTITVDEDGTTHFRGHPAKSAEMAKLVLRRLKMDNDTINKVSILVKYHDYGYSLKPEEKFIRRAINKIGKDNFPLLLEVKKADVLAQSEYKRAEKLENISEWDRIYKEILERGECVSIKELKINGSDLIGLGAKPGPKIGDILSKLLDEVLDEPEKNNPEYLKNRAKELLSEK
ncbi:MAG: CCA tRNA nucleotidyltransferase [Lachnospiraceae bacterium]|nr:CCA tRNA nucleotidyltransferase [Lachnospiraceae bacterium]